MGENYWGGKTAIDFFYLLQRQETSALRRSQVASTTFTNENFFSCSYRVQSAKTLCANCVHVLFLRRHLQPLEEGRTYVSHLTIMDYICFRIVMMMMEGFGIVTRAGL